VELLLAKACLSIPRQPGFDSQYRQIDRDSFDFFAFISSSVGAFHIYMHRPPRSPLLTSTAETWDLQSFTLTRLHPLTFNGFVSLSRLFDHHIKIAFKNGVVSEGIVALGFEEYEEFDALNI
jgi:hypothetical protein